jgi:hypothetical protein
MPTKLSEKAVEGSTFTIRAAFNEILPDGSKAPFVPNSPLTWSLRDKDGAVINARIAVPLVPAEEVDIVLFGDDLALRDNHPLRRFVTVIGTYNGVAGNDLPLIDEVSFQILNLVGVRVLSVQAVGITIIPVVGTPSVGLV